MSQRPRVKSSHELLNASLQRYFSQQHKIIMQGRENSNFLEKKKKTHFSPPEKDKTQNTSLRITFADVSNQAKCVFM